MTQISANTDYDLVEHEGTIDPDWLDDFPLIDGALVLSHDILDFFRRYSQVAQPRDLEILVYDSSIFIRRYVLRNCPGTIWAIFCRRRITATLFVSSLEAASAPEIDPATCKSCGKAIYKISKRIRERWSLMPDLSLPIL